MLLCCRNQDPVIHVEQARRVGQALVLHALAVVHPHLRQLLGCAADVRVWLLQDVL